MITYLLLANLYLATFYTFYHFVLRKQTFFRLNRYFLLGSMAFAFLLPLANINAVAQFSQPLFQKIVLKTENVPELRSIFMNPIEVTISDPGQSSGNNELWGKNSTVVTLYLIGCMVAFLMLIIRAKYTFNAFKNPHRKVAFSFFHFVRIGKELRKHHAIARHEHVHVQEWHSLDIVIIQLLKIFNWFNPFIYAIERSIKLQHEYYADQKASGLNQVAYAKLLLASAFDVLPQNLSNPFNNPPVLKSRIMMLLKNRTPKQNLVKLALILPLVGGMIVFSSACNSGDKGNQNPKNDAPVSGEVMETTRPSQTNSAQIDLNIHHYADVEITPVPDNDEYKTINEFRHWISENYTIPADAIDAGVAGKIVATFTIDESGQVVDVIIVEDLGHGTGEAFKSLLERSHKWKPGIVNGQAVATQFTLPMRINAMQ